MCSIKIKKIAIIVLLFLQTISCNELKRKFPKDFQFGVGSSAYQIEGAWNEDGKSENIWDRFIHTNPHKILKETNADKACGSYHHTKEDVQMIKNLGVNYYRFSLSWSRILPEGFANKINQKALNYYNNLIDSLVAHNITPIVTLYHWDLPQKLQDFGGWVNPNLVPIFEDYARVAFENFGDRVPFWITFNEPHHVCVEGYGGSLKAPAMGLGAMGDYLCGHTILKAHAKVYHLYRNDFSIKFKGKISIALDVPWFEPHTNSSEDIEATERIRQFSMGWFANPIYNNGNYPEVMIEAVRRKSSEEGYPRSRLPVFTSTEQEYIKGTFDFFALNTYSTRMVKNTNSSSTKIPSNWLTDASVEFLTKPEWDKRSASDWLKVVPWGFSKLLKWLKTNYGDVQIYVTENGYSDHRGQLNDTERISYHQQYLNALLDAVEDGVNVKGYTFWTLMDNFEWTEGYEHVFGLYSVDLESFDRVPKASALWVKNLVKNRQLSTTKP